MPGLPSTIGELRATGPNRRDTIAQLRADYPSTRYLSLDPAVPVLSGDRPRLLDAFSLDLAVENGTPAGLDLASRAARREFDVIYVRDDSTLARDMKPGEVDFAARCEAFWARDRRAIVRVLRGSYRVAEVRRPFVVLVPQGG